MAYRRWVDKKALKALVTSGGRRGLRKGLSVLGLRDAGDGKEDSLLHLTQLRGLRSLDLRSCHSCAPLTNAGLGELGAGCPKLERLGLGDACLEAVTTTSTH